MVRTMPPWYYIRSTWTRTSRDKNLVASGGGDSTEINNRIILLTGKETL